MAPNLTGPATGLFLAEAEVLPTKQQNKLETNNKTILKQQSTNKTVSTEEDTKEKPYVYKVELVWFNVFAMLYLHIGALYGSFLLLSGQCKFYTFMFAFMYAWWAGTGITGGAHRLWAHKAYKARWPLRVFLALAQTAAFQNHIYEWVRDHRVHHKFCDTNADPHNSKRGFFFSHIGWLMCRKHKDVIEKGKTVDISDLEKDWVVMFQKRNYLWLVFLWCFAIPSIIPWYFWGEDGWVSYWCAGVLRYTVSLNGTWLVNSAAHMWGDKPYDRNATSSQNLTVAVLALGEGWHNYHHAFPWDYKASELFNLNSTTRFINVFAKIGWAYDLKEASPELIKRKIANNKLNKPVKKNHHEGEVWGWGDKDMPQEDVELISIKAKKE